MIPYLCRLILGAVTICSMAGCATEALRDNTVNEGATTSDLLYQMALSNIAEVRYFNGDNSKGFTKWNNCNPTLDPNNLADPGSVRVTVPATPSNPGATSTTGTGGGGLTEAQISDIRTMRIESTPGVSLHGAPKVPGKPAGQDYAVLLPSNGDVIPWAYDISGGTIAVNDSIGVTPTLGVDMSSVHVFHPGVSVPMSRAFQQSWTVTPVTDTIALNLIKGYYYDASVATYADEHGKRQPLFRNGGAPIGDLKGSYRDKTVWIPKDDPYAMASLTHLVQKVMAAVEDADERAGARKSGNVPPNTQPPIFINGAR